jgi:NDP-sugar pyrophosphorylase family protein
MISISNLLQVASGDVASAKIQKYVKSEPLLQGLSIRVVTVPSNSGSADAVRAVADKLRGDLVVVMSGDTVTDVSLPTVLFQHRIRGSAITTVLSKSKDSAAAGTKIGKAPKVNASFCIVTDP